MDVIEPICLSQSACAKMHYMMCIKASAHGLQHICSSIDASMNSTLYPKVLFMPTGL